jgi:hypothetical protein
MFLISKKQLLFILLLIPLFTFPQVKKTYPAEVETVLKKAGTNRSELEKAILYIKKSKDPLKLKAIYFLIANMDIHYTMDFFWADSLGKKITYNELDYPDFNIAQQAREEIKKKTRGIHAQPIILPDIENIKADYLIENIENAFRVWHKSIAKKIPFTDFCEYILPYRTSVEPLESWRTVYEKKFQWISDSIKVLNLEKTLPYVVADCQSWFTDTWGKEKSEPLPLGALQLLLSKKGTCEEIANVQMFILRSQGIPISYNIVPYWATSAGDHSFNTVFNSDTKPIQYDAPNTSLPVNYKLPREPSKVLRVTYSKQPGVLANFEDSKNIPEGVMQTKNYVDITGEVWETANVKCPLFASKDPSKIVYACVFNAGRWKPCWWGKAIGDSVNFTSMAKGVVYLPAHYIDNAIIPVGFPMVEGYHHEMLLAPDTINKRTITINEQERYLIFRPGKSYKLYYWDNTWKLAGIKTAEKDAHTMLFENVPTNALFRLIPEYSRGLERPFIIAEDGKRAWF